MIKNWKWVIIIGVMVLTNGCIQESIPTPTIGPTKESFITQTPPDIMQKIVMFVTISISDLSQCLSPDEKWLVLTPYIVPNMDAGFQIASLLTDNLILQSELDANYRNNLFQSIISWSNDSTAVITYGGSAPRAEDRLIIYEIDGGNLERSEYYFTGIQPEYVLWSPDSKEIMWMDRVTHQIKIIDRKGNELRTKQIVLNGDERVNDIQWVGHSFFYIVGPQDTDVRTSEVVIYRIDDDLDGEPEKVFTAPEQYDRADFSSIYDHGQNFLINLIDDNSATTQNVTYDRSQYAIYILDWQTGVTEIVPTTNNCSALKVSSTDYRYTALSCNDQMRIYDWDTKTIQAYGKVVGLSRWLESEQGFLVQINYDRNGYGVVIP